MPKCLIGIPSLNGSEQLDYCLRSIFSVDDGVKKTDSKVLVIDDGSSPPELERTKTICGSYGVDLLMNPGRKGVAKSWNTLCRHVDSEFIVLLNNDIEVKRFWLEALLYSLDKNRSLGAIGLNAYEGPERYSAPPSLSYEESKILIGGLNTPMLSCKGYAFGFTRESYNLTEGFDERYFYFFEEIDFCLTLLTKGRRSAMLSSPPIYHRGGATTVMDSDRMQIFAESQRLFEEKWKIVWKDLRILFPYIASIDKLDEWNTNLGTWQ
jgi:hypothetical protein